jgi:choice-of-anchor B domain-containing protein
MVICIINFMIGKKISLFVLTTWLAVSSLAQISYNTTLLGRWSNDSLPALGNPAGQRFNELWGYFDSIKSREYIMMGGLDSTYFFDVTDPAHIKLCDVKAGASKSAINRDYQTYSHYAYAVNDETHGSLQVFDMQYLPDSVHKVYDSDSLGKTTHTICVYKDKLYMCSNTNATRRYALRIASLADPENPTNITTFDAPVVGGVPLFANIHDMIVVDDTAYLSCGNDGLFIFDFTNPLAPKYVYSLTVYQEKGYNHNSWLTADKKHIVFTDENLGLGIKLFEIENPTSYKHRSTFRSHNGAMAHSPFIVGNTMAYVSYYQDGVYLFDISDAYNPNVLAYYDTYPENNAYTGFQGCWGVYPFLPSGNIFASDMSHGLFALRMNVTGINSNALQKEKLELSPNPAGEMISIKLFSPADEKAQLEITDCKGQKILSRAIDLQFGKNVLDLKTDYLSPGIYFIQFTSAHASYTSKLFKK